jgi:hypothetical protein
MPNQTWAMDFVHDQLAMGKKITVLMVVYMFSKFSPAIDPRSASEPRMSWRLSKGCVRK